MRILVVEDDPILGEGIAIGLRQTKATVDWFRSAEDAMAALATESFSAERTPEAMTHRQEGRCAQP